MKARTYVAYPLLCSFLAVLFLCANAHALPTEEETAPRIQAPMEQEDIPAQLKPWTTWVLHDMQEHFCPTQGNDAEERTCAFPVKLSLDVRHTGAEFEQTWHIYAPQAAALPYAKDVWPENVRVNGEPTPVVDINGQPALQLQPGEHLVTGKLPWNEQPEVLRLPPASGIISLTKDGVTVPFPDFGTNGHLRLSRQRKETRAEDVHTVEIFRLVQDFLPMEITTHVQLHVSGKARRITLDGVLPKDSTPTRVSSPLPLSFGPNESLNVQAGPGSWAIEVTTRLPGPISKLGPLTTPFGREFWSFQADNSLRVVELQGIPGVDPQTTDIPAAWKQYPAYMVDQGAQIVFNEMHRGVPAATPDELTLNRQAWLDFDGKGITIKDAISGAIRQNWVLTMAPRTELGRATIGGKDQPIVMLGKEKHAGIELRNGKLKLNAESRLNDFDGKIPSTGWEKDFQSLSILLHLPPGWNLFTVTGVDRVDNSWVSSWTLLDIFLVLVISIAIFKLQRPALGLLALVFFALSYHEPGVPQISWIFLLSALGLMKVLSGTEMFQTWTATKKAVIAFYCCSLVAIVLISIPFMFHQLRWGLYPQLAPHSYSAPTMAGNNLGVANDGMLPEEQAMEEPMLESMAPPRKPARPSSQVQRRAKILPKMIETESSVESDQKQAYYRKQQAPKKKTLMYDPEALVQTGPGIPTWSWNWARFQWNGPVTQSESLNVWLISPRMNYVLAILRVLLLVCVLGPLVDIRRLHPKVKKKAAQAATAACLALALGALTLTTPTTALAEDYPPEHVLDELQQRLLEPDDCYPHCISSPALEVSVDNEQLRVLFFVDAATRTTVPLPVVTERWQAQRVLLNEKDVQLYRAGKTLMALVPKGKHRILLQGPIPRSDSFQISLPLASHRARVTAPGWDVQGIGTQGELEGALRLARLQKPSDVQKTVDTYRIPPFLHVERTVTLGLNWDVRTTVTRVTPVGDPVVVQVPLLKGEAVLSENVEVKNRHALLNMSPSQKSFSWDSRLEQAQKLELKAPENVDWVETWSLTASPIWNLLVRGIPPMRKLDAQGNWAPTWRPWPGETLDIDITRPKPAPGASMTITSVNATYTPGTRLDENQLRLTIRASKGGRHTIKLPEGAQLTKLTAQGRELPHTGVSAGEVDFPITPGTQDIVITWRQKRDSSILFATPVIDLAHAAVNATLKMSMPRDSWTLAIWGGPLLGPAVRFWSYLAAMVIAAFALGFVPFTPLRRWQWFLFGVGMSQVAPLVAVISVAWLLMLGLRKEHYIKKGWFTFNVVQFALAGLTVAGLVCLYLAVQQGLLGSPAMQIAGNNSTSYHLIWTQDRVAGVLPQPSVFTVPLWCYRALMLAWSLWLAVSLLSWLRWGWGCITQGDLLRKPVFHKRPTKKTQNPLSDKLQK